MKAKNKNYKGPDGIFAFLHVNLFDVFGAFYTQIFNTFYNENYIPETWKFSVITPLYKKQGSRTNFENYRPITKTFSISRIFETAIKTKLEECLIKNISNYQHGFLISDLRLQNY